MKKVIKENKEPIAAELDALFDNARPIEELDLKGLAQAFEELDHDPSFVADSTKALFVEDVLRALNENAVSKSELARRMGKTRQQITILLDEQKRNNFTIETMAKVSTALGRKLFVRMIAPAESVYIDHAPVEQPSPRARLRGLLMQDWAPDEPKLNLNSIKKAQLPIVSKHDNLIPFPTAA
jgi:transcriptional regulator with XRE-family HTH domain